MGSRVHSFGSAGHPASSTTGVGVGVGGGVDVRVGQGVAGGAGVAWTAVITWDRSWADQQAVGIIARTRSPAATT
jgi:hypothetical protein